MPVKAGQIVIDITAGTSKFVVDMEAAKGKIREFGREAHASVTGVQAVSANLRVLEGNMTNNLRAAERFLTLFPAIEKAARLAFPIAGAVAFGGIVVELGEKIYDFFRQLEEAPEKVSAAWSKINTSFVSTNAELALTGARLDEDIARLQGKPENGLAIGLAEANVAATKLGDTLDSNLSKIYEVFKQHDPSFWQQLLGAISNKTALEAIGGLTGGGALVAESRQNTLQRAQLGPAFDQQYYAAQLGVANRARDILLNNQKELESAAKNIEQFIGKDSADYVQNQKARELADQELYAADLNIAQLRQQIANGEKERTKTQLEIGNRASEAAAEALKKIEQYERGIFEGGLTPVNKIYAKRDDLGFAPGTAYGERATDAANREAQRFLDAEDEKVSKQSDSIFGFRSDALPNVGHVSGSADNQLRKNFEDSNKEADAILKEWSQGIFKSFKTNFEQSKKEAEENFKVGNTQAQEAAEHGIETNTINKLRLEAQYASQRSHSFQEELRYMRQIAAYEESDLKLKLEAAEAELDNAHTLGDKEKIEEKNLEVDKARLALKKQQLETTVREATVQAQHPFADGSLRSGVDQFFTDMATKAKQPGEILYDGMTSAVDRVSDELSKLFTGQKTNWGQAFQQLGGDVVRESLKSATQTGLGKIGEALHIPGAAKKPTLAAGDPGHVIVDNLPTETGTGAGAPRGGGGLNLGGIFGAGAIGGGIFSALGGIRKLFGSGLTEAVSSAISFPALAGGGNVDPGHPYWVGDGGNGSGTELFVPQTAGTVVPMSHLGGGVTYIVNAPGSQLGVENRIQAMLETVHNSSVNSSVSVQHDRTRRTPQKQK